MEKVRIIGGGLAGSECAIYLAERGVKVKLYDIKQIRKRRRIIAKTLPNLFVLTHLRVTIFTVTRVDYLKKKCVF